VSADSIERAAGRLGDPAGSLERARSCPELEELFHRLDVSLGRFNEALALLELEPIDRGEAHEHTMSGWVQRNRRSLLDVLRAAWAAIAAGGGDLAGYRSGRLLQIPADPDWALTLWAVPDAELRARAEKWLRGLGGDWD
jgi:hypothetical protein